MTDATGHLRPTDVALERDVRRAMLLRVTPLLFGLYAFFALDRGNVGLAALEMNTSLGLTSRVYGVGASLFTLAYLIFQVPCTLMMKRLGAARGLGIVACLWGVVSISTAFVWDATSFLVVRFALGAAEAGFGTFVIYYIGTLFPRAMRGLALSMTLVAVPVTMMIASPLSGLLLNLDVAGLQGWQWLFLIEGAPAVLLGLCAWRLLPDAADDALFLTVDQRAWLASDVAEEPVHQKARVPIGSLLQAARSATVWVLGMTLFSVVLGTNTLLFWMPQIIAQASNGTNVLVGLLNAVPWLVFGIGMLVMGRISDRLHNKAGAVCLVLLVAGAGFVLGGSSDAIGIAFAGLLLGAFGIGAAMSIFWTVPMQVLGGVGLAAAFAAINLIGNSSGVFAHGLIGWLHDRTGSFASTLLALGITLVVPVIVLFLFDRRMRRGSHMAYPAAVDTGVQR